LVKAESAASVLTELESSVDAFGVAADAFVVNRVSEMPKESFCEWRNVRAESVVNPSAFLAGPDKASVAQKSQVSGKVDLVKRMFLLGLIAVISARCRNSRSERRVPQISVSHFVPIAYTAPRCVI
jgi:hypothetical protein